MGKIFETQFEKGTYVEKFTKTEHSTELNNSLRRGDKGIELYCEGTGYISFNNATDVHLALDDKIAVGEEFSAEVWFKTNDEGSVQHVWGFTNTGGDRYVCGIHSDGEIRFSELSGSDVSGGSVAAGEWCHVVVTQTTGNVFSLYVNNVEYTGSNANTLHYANEFLSICAGTSGASSLDGPVAKLVLYDHILTVKERADAYERFAKAYPLGDLKYPRHNPHEKPTDLSNEVGLVAAYNMIPSEDTLVDISGNGYNGTIIGAINSVNGLVFDGVNDYVNCGAVSGLGNNDWTITMRVKLGRNDVNQSFVTQDNGSSDFSFRIDVAPAYDLDVIVFSEGNSAIFLRYQAENAFAPTTFNDYVDVWFDLVVTFQQSSKTIKAYRDGIELGETTVATGTFVSMKDGIDLAIGAIGRVTPIYYAKQEMSELLVYNYAFTEQQAQDYHNKFAKRLALVEDFSDDADEGVPRNWVPGTGTYEVKELTSQDSVLKHLESGTKYLECTSAGTIALPSKNVPGTIEFYWNKSEDGTPLFSIFNTQADASGDGFLFRSNNSEVTGLYRVDSGALTAKFYSGAFYIDAETWYQVKITNTKNGEKYTYMRGGALGSDYVLVDDSGGGANPSTDNTYTAGEYIVADLDLGDKIGPIKITEGVEQ